MANSRCCPVYALRNWSVKKLARGWYISHTSTTYSDEKRAWKGPCNSIARDVAPKFYPILSSF